MDTDLQNYLNWSPINKLIFRFIFILFLLFILLFNNGVFPFINLVVQFPAKIFALLNPWLAEQIFHLPEILNNSPNGSGDTSYQYITLFAITLIACTGAIIWTLADRKTKNYNKLYYWLTVAVRFYVGLMLINYGFYKVFKSQFPSPGFFRLMQPYGDSSPMGLAWTFLGFSKGYNFFMGFAELMGVLLLFRRTVTAGAIISLMTSANVMAVNYFYDVPVKILSTALVIFCLFLLSINFNRLVQFFFTAQPTSLCIVSAPPIRKKWLLYGLRSVKFLIIFYVLLTGFNYARRGQKLYGEDAPKPPLYGLYAVETFIADQDTLQPLLTDTKRWKQLIVEWPDYARVKLMNDSVYTYNFKPDTVKKNVEVRVADGSERETVLSYQIPDKDHLILRGKLEGDSVTIKLIKLEKSSFRLMNRGFRWINEYPFNR